MVLKSLAFTFNGKNELLVFEHPITKLIEVVRGTVEENEQPEQTIVRELKEEAGINYNEIENIGFIGRKTMLIPGGFDRKEKLEGQIYFGYRIKLTTDKETWTHKVVSDGIDNGHQYTFKWIELNQNNIQKLNPHTKEYMNHFKLITDN